MKKVPTLTVFLILCIYSASAQKYGKVANPSYRFESVPGFINISELNAAIAVGDSMATTSRYYFGLTNVFGYQINRNFSGGVGIGLLKYDTRQLIPIYLEYKFNFYLKSGTPYLFADGGALQDPVDFLHESKLFINPGYRDQQVYFTQIRTQLISRFNGADENIPERSRFCKF